MFKKSNKILTYRMKRFALTINFFMRLCVILHINNLMYISSVKKHKFCFKKISKIYAYSRNRCAFP